MDITTTNGAADSTTSAPATAAAAPAESVPAPAKAAKKTARKRAPAASKKTPSTAFKPSGMFEGKSMAQLVEIYNGLVKTAIEHKVKGVDEVKSFVDEKTGRLACERLHAQINKPREAKETTVSTRTSSKARQGGRKTAKATKTAKKAKGGNGVGRYAEDAKITWLGKEIPFKEGSGAHERTVRVQKHNGKTVAAFVKAGGKTSTLHTMEREKLARVG